MKHLVFVLLALAACDPDPTHLPPQPDKPEAGCDVTGRQLYEIGRRQGVLDEQERQLRLEIEKQRAKKEQLEAEIAFLRQRLDGGSR